MWTFREHMIALWSKIVSRADRWAACILLWLQQSRRHVAAASKDVREYAMP